MATALNHWVLGDNETVEFYLDVDGQTQVARISRECLEDHFGANGNFLVSGPQAFLANAAAICEKAAAKIAAGEPVPVVVGTRDF